jgi:hypothetical protein
MNGGQKEKPVAGEGSPGDGVVCRYGLMAADSGHPGIVRYAVDLDRLLDLQCFADVHGALTDALSSAHDDSTAWSYVLWGGFAANVALMLLHGTRQFFSLHDIEVFAARAGHIVHDAPLVEHMRRAILRTQAAPLAIGGQPLAAAMAGRAVSLWQRERVLRRDGDLEWSNVIIHFTLGATTVDVEAPRDVIAALCQGSEVIRMKPTDEVRTIDRVARRIYRNISKAIRLERVSALTVDKNTSQAMEQLVDMYARLLKRAGGTDGLAGWCRTNDIEGTVTGMRWLYRRVVTETVMRLAGLYGVSSEDRKGFEALLTQDATGIAWVQEHQLVKLVQPDGAGGLQDHVEPCFAAFNTYQAAGAEALCGAYATNRG